MPGSTLTELNNYCTLLEKLHLRRCGSDQRVKDHETLKEKLEQPIFKNVRNFTCRHVEIFHALSILRRCPNVKTAVMTCMAHRLARIEGIIMTVSGTV
jgi:hypothetical protein